MNSKVVVLSAAIVLSCGSVLTACDEVLGVCLETSRSPAGAKVTKVTGQLAHQLFRDGDSQRYELISELHVITAVNGQSVSTREECDAALKLAARGSFTVDVYNVTRGTTLTYTTRSESGDLPLPIDPVRATPGSEHPTLPNVVAGTKTGTWLPRAGYAWVEKRNMNRGVEWKWNQYHPDLRGIYSSRTEGQWNLQPGYDWLTNTPGDLRTRYVGVDFGWWTPPSVPDSNYGSGDGGMTPQEAWRIGNQYRHSPWNYRGHVSPPRQFNER